MTGLEKISPTTSQDGASLAGDKAQQQQQQQQPSRTSSRRPSLTHPQQPVLLSLVPSIAASVPPVVTSGAEGTAQDGGEEDGTGHLAGAPLVLALVALNLSTVLVFLDNSILSTATPTITNEFHSVQDIGWYVSSYQLAMSAMQPMTGKLFTYLPNKQTYISSVLLFELGSLICGLSTSSNMLIGGRAVAGLGASGLFNGALTIIAALVPLRRRPAVTGLLMGVGQLGLVGGPLIGGALTQYSTWRWCFYINLPVGGVAALALAAVRIPEQAPKPAFRSFVGRPGLWRRFDLPGTALLVPAVVMLLLALHYGGGGYPWGSATVVGLFCGAAAVGALFVAWEWRVGAGDAMVPLSMFRERVLVAGCLTNLCLFSCAFITSYFLPLYFQSVQGSSPFTAGVHMLPSIISQLITAVLSGLAVSRLGYYLPWAIFSAVLASIGSGLITTWTVGTNTGTWIGYQIILGVGRGAGMQMGLIAVQTVLQPSQIAVAMAMLTFVQGLGSAVLISVANTIFDDSLASQIRSRAPHVNPEAVIAAGATAFRKVVSADDVPAVVRSYAVSFDRTFYLAVALSALCFFTSLGLGNHDVRVKQNAKGDGEDEGEAAVESRQEKKEDTIV